MTKNVLITGGLGYLGGRIAETLTRSLHYKLRLGDLKQSIQSVSREEEREIVSIDLALDETLSVACQGVDFVIHLAAMNEIQCVEDPDRAMLINGLGTSKLLKAAIEQGVKRFLFFSTAHVYGSPLAGEISEETEPHPTHPYAITKRAGEDFVLAARNSGKIEGVVFRLSNGLGAPVSQNIDRWTLICNDLCRQAVVEKKLVLRSSGLQQRDFIAIADVARAVRHFLTISNNELQDGLFNLGGECPMRIIDLAERVSERCEVICGFSPEIVYVQSKSTDEETLPLNYSVDKLKQTGFSLVGNICEEIDKTLLFCQQAWGSKS